MDIRFNNNSYLFFYVILCSYANFRTSYHRIESTYFTVYPGHWICKLSDIVGWFRLRSQKQAIKVLDILSQKNLITYNLLHNGKIVNFKINGWKNSNIVLEYNSSCQKDEGFFFFPISKGLKLIDGSKCSEMDILLDIWLNTVLNDVEVKGSNLGPIAYFRGFRDTAIISNTELAKRWGISRTTVFRILKKFQQLDLIEVIHFAGASGSVIYTKKYMQTMFEVEDIYLDKEDVFVAFETDKRMPSKDEYIVDVDYSINEPVDEIIAGSKENNTGSYYNIVNIVKQLQETLINKGINDFQNGNLTYKLSPLSLDCMGYINRFILIIEGTSKQWVFEITVKDVEDG